MIFVPQTISIFGRKSFKSTTLWSRTEILKCSIKFIKKNQIALVAHYFFLNLFSSDLVFNIFTCIFCSIYVQNLYIPLI